MKKNQMIKRLWLVTLFLLLATGLNGYSQNNLKSNDQAPGKSADVIKRLGVFTNMRYTQEHQYGYSVELWQEKDHIFGLFLVSEGLAGDTPTGLLEDIVFDAKTGKLAFRSRLSTASTFNKNNEQVPTRDVFQFRGRLQGQKLVGILQRTDALATSATGTKKNISLTRSKSESESMSKAKNYDEWKQEAEETLKFRGPKW